MRRIVLCLAWTLSAVAADEPRLEIDSGGHQALIKMVSFTRDGKYLVSAGDDKVVRVWDLSSGKTARKILGQIGDGDIGKIYAAALSPDDRYLAVGGYLSAAPDVGVIRIHDFRSGGGRSSPQRSYRRRIFFDILAGWTLPSVGQPR